MLYDVIFVALGILTVFLLCFNLYCIHRLKIMRESLREAREIVTAYISNKVYRGE